MDPFSHLLLGYLLGFGLWGPSGLPYVIAAAVAGALPDADVVLYPLSKRFPLLRHRGISHSIVGVTIIAAVGTFAVPYAMGRGLGPAFAVGTPWAFFASLEIGGLSHVLLDSMDHWSVPILAPFSRHEYRFDADRIVNVGSMAFTVIAYAVLLDERGRAPVWLWSLTSWVLLGLALGYIGIRLLARWRAGAAQRRLGYQRVIPQASPLTFLFVAEEPVANGRRFRVGIYDLLRGSLRRPKEMELGESPDPSLPVRTDQDAVARSYAPALAASWTLGETLHFAEVRATPGCFEVFWYSLEFQVFGRNAGVLARVDRADGTVVTKSMWRSPATIFS